MATATNHIINTPSNLPSWLYELLPLIYIASGLMVFELLGGGFAVLSSFLLVFAGVGVLSMRRKFRSAAAKLKKRPLRRRAM